MTLPLHCVMRLFFSAEGVRLCVYEQVSNCGWLLRRCEIVGTVYCIIPLVTYFHKLYARHLISLGHHHKIHIISIFNLPCSDLSSNNYHQTNQPFAISATVACLQTINKHLVRISSTPAHEHLLHTQPIMYVCECLYVCVSNCPPHPNARNAYCTE